jgi:cobalt transporter subunit CbtB
MNDQAVVARTGVSSAAPARVASLAPVFLAAFLGAFLVWGVGFAQNDLLHNAAHDTRHSNGFPCH